MQSTLTVHDIVQFAVDSGHAHAVVSDFESAHSWPKFYREARQHNLIPVFGLQLNYRNANLLLLAKNRDGFVRLLKIAGSKECLEQQMSSDLIVIHLEGEDCFPDLPKYVANEECENGVFVRENKFLEASDFECFCALRAIDNNSSVKEERMLNAHFQLDYLKGPVDHIGVDSFQIKNIQAILNQCTLYNILSPAQTLNFLDDPEKKLQELLYDLFGKLSFKDESQRVLYRTRLDEEFQVVLEKGFCEYFLIVYDAVKWSKDNGIYVGPGRGSVCGSLMAYVLGITEIDPIFYDLYFERFLNKTRTTIPDIDIDVANNRRDDLFRYLREKYGEDHVALIAVYRTFKVKHVVREVGKAYGVPAPMLESFLRDAGEGLDFGRGGLARLSRDYPHLVPVLTKLYGFPCNMSVHAAGVVISSAPLSDLIPLSPVSHSPLLSSQWDANELKDLGFIKFDFLALQYLQSLNNIEARVAKEIGKPIVWTEVDLNDQKVYDTLIKGHNLFIFQFESLQIKKLIHNFKPSTLLDLALISSIHRPGASDQVPTLLARRTSSGHGLFQSSQHEGLVRVNSTTVGPLTSILHNTYGLLIYQEQLMKIVSTATSCSFGESDNFRRGISKYPEKIPRAKQWFFSKSANRFSRKELESLWEAIFKFAKYGFNKSHAVAYAMISYRLMWLKTHYPEFFYSEFLSHSVNPGCFYELEELGFTVMAPTYGKSDFRMFKLVDKCFYFPVSAIVGLNASAEDFAKVTGGAKTAVEAVMELMRLGIHAKNIQLLIRAGFFNEMFAEGESEAFLEQNLDSIKDNSILREDGTPLYRMELQPVTPTMEDKKRYITYQKELLGMGINTGRISPKLFRRYRHLSRINSLPSQIDKVAVYVGFLNGSKIAETYRDDSFLLFRISDGFYISPFIALFGRSRNEMEHWLSLSQNHVPVVLEIEKRGDGYVALSMREIKHRE